jgi:Flp pilus assembly protein TadD
MPIEQLYLLSGMIFRIVVVLSGTFTTYLGYRLLSRGIAASQRHAATDATARFGKASFALRRMTPGAVYALFGMSLVAIMIYVDAPEFRQETRAGESSLTLRGDANNSTDANLQAANELLRSGKLRPASEEYARYFATLATATNNFALVLLKQSRTEEAITLSRLATSLRPGDDELVKTYAAALEQGGQKAESDRVTHREMQLTGFAPN